jgi:murein DD-endopeptidase MepM/ murein hydrolase activator NlpD
MKKSYLLLIIILFLHGCATAPSTPSHIVRSTATGSYHEVRRGQTLWSISKAYDVPLDNLIKSNRLPDASKIEVGQLIFVPGKTDNKSVVAHTKASKIESFIWPIKGKVVSYFGSTSNLVQNKGIDIEVPNNRNVIASRSGKISFVSDNLEGYGKTIIIDHPEGFQTVYAYNSKIIAALNTYVNQGDVIAKTGSTGRAKGPMLHFEIRKNHKAQNPFYYLP